MKEYVIDFLSEDLNKVIQSRLFELGYRWTGTGKEYWDNDKYPILIRDGEMSINSGIGRGLKGYISKGYEELTIPDLFNGNFKEFESNKFELNSSYTAEFRKNDVKIGCQTFEIEKIEQFIEAFEVYYKK